MNIVQLAIGAIVASAACTPVPNPPVTAAPNANSATPVQAHTRGEGVGSIAGTVATNPYHAIKGGGVVYLEDGPRDTTPPISATLDNHDMEFVPAIVVVPAKGSVIFTNTDPMMHNAFSPDGEKWDLGEIPQNGSVVKRFDNPGGYTVLCNLHPSMVAHLLVTPSSNFARIDPTGAYVLKNVPPGTYRVTAWVPRLKVVTQSVTVTTGEITANFDLER
jgi:plastocyanin